MGYRASVGRVWGGGADPVYITRFKGSKGYAKLFLEGGREMAGVGIARSAPPS